MNWVGRTLWGDLLLRIELEGGMDGKKTVDRRRMIDIELVDGEK